MSRSRSRRQQRANRNVRIVTTFFSVMVVLSLVLGLVGPYLFRGSDGTPPTPTFAFPTPAPLSSPTPSPTPTAGVPTPVIVTPTSP